MRHGWRDIGIADGGGVGVTGLEAGADGGHEIARLRPAEAAMAALTRGQTRVMHAHRALQEHFRNDRRNCGN